MSAAELRTRLENLYIERFLAEPTGLVACAAYMADLEDEIDECRSAYIGTAVTEIASFRRALSGPQIG